MSVPNVSFIFGRMNPPTRGHIHIIKTMIADARRKGVPSYVFVTHTQDKFENPIPSSLKVHILKTIFSKSEYPNLTIKSTEPKPGKLVTITNVRRLLMNEMGFKNPAMMLGSNRINKQNFKFLNKMGITRTPIGESRADKTKFSPKEMQSRINRGNISVMSGTLARKAAASPVNNLKKLRKIMDPSLNNATLKQIISWVKKGRSKSRN